MYDCVWCADDKLAWINSYNFELDRTEASAHKEQITSTARPVSFEEVGLQVCLKEVSCDALNCIVQRQDMDTLAVGHIATSMDRDNISKTHAKILSHDLVQSHLLVIEVVICKHNANRVLALFAFDQYVVSAEEVQLLHFCLGERDYRIVIVESLLNDEAVWRPLLGQLLGLRCYGSTFWSWICHLIGDVARTRRIIRIEFKIVA
mmetsp:Transcript_150964/g.277285  ORF Transcript_150964/g.277285 Transcript_150964/m.277285 type:complete len:205 (+) Transcript_150964:1921-2535(+)